MAAKGQYLVTLADVAKSKDKQVGKVAEVLALQNPILNVLPYMEMNGGTKHVEDIRSGLPEVYYRKANQPIPASKTTTEEREFQAAHFESKSQMDEAVADRGGKDRRSYNRWNQAKGHIQANGHEHASLLFYGSPSSATEKTPGLADVYSTLATTEPTSKQIVDAGGSGSDNTSIYKLHLGESAIFGIYPAGTKAGLQREDMGRVQIYGTDKNGNAGTFWGFEERFMIDHGLVVKDYRQGARIANINVSNAVAGVSAADLIDLMISADYRIDSLENGKGVWIMNRTLMAVLHKQALNKVGAGAGLTFENFFGKKVMSFLGSPILRCDSLLSTEAQVTS